MSEPALVGSAGFPRPTQRSGATSGPSSSPGSLCAWRQDNLLVTAQATGFPSLSLTSVQQGASTSADSLPGHRPRALFKPRWLHDPSLTAGWLPPPSARWQSTDPLSRRPTHRAQPRPQRPARLCQAAPPSWLQTPTPGQGPPARRPSSRKTQSCLQNKSMLMSGCRTGLHICSAEVPLQTSPASPPAPQPPTLGVGGWGLGEGAKLSLRFHFKRMRIYPQPTQSTYHPPPPPPSTPQAQEKACKGGGKCSSLTFSLVSN